MSGRGEFWKTELAKKLKKYGFVACGYVHRRSLYDTRTTASNGPCRGCRVHLHSLEGWQIESPKRRDFMLELTLRTTPPGPDETSTFLFLWRRRQEVVPRERKIRGAEIGASIETTCNGPRSPFGNQTKTILLVNVDNG